MNLQINLLKKSEQRYQGIVSMKVMAVGSVSLLVGISLLAFLLAGISKMTLSSNLQRARQEWKMLEPKAAVLRAAQAASTANRKTLSELKSWSAVASLPMYEVLRSVQENIPDQMELWHFSAGITQPDEKEPLTYKFRISGTAIGELTAVEAKRKLNADAELRSFCGEVKLISSKRYFDEAWAFELEGHRSAGDARQ
jgi:hypothetical protein